jgi:hypothetical protein
LNGNEGIQPAASFWEQFSILSQRTLINLYRNPMLLVMHYSISILLGLLLGTLFWNVSNDLAGVQNRLGSLFFMCALLGFASLSSLEVCDGIVMFDSRSVICGRATALHQRTQWRLLFDGGVLCLQNLIRYCSLAVNSITRQTATDFKGWYRR